MCEKWLQKFRVTFSDCRRLSPCLIKLPTAFRWIEVFNGVATPLSTSEKPSLVWGKWNNKSSLSKHITRKNGIINSKRGKHNLTYCSIQACSFNLKTYHQNSSPRLYLQSILPKFLFCLFDQDRTIAMLRKLKENRSSSTALLEGMMILLFAVLAFVFFL